MTPARLIAALLLTAAFIAPASAMPTPIMRIPSGLAPPFMTQNEKLARAAHPAALSPVQAAQFTTIDAPGAGTGSGQGTVAYAINSTGTIAGYYEDGSGNVFAFILANGSFTTFGVNGGQALAYGINDKGDVSGTYFDTNSGTWRAFLRTPSGKFKTFDPANDNGSGIFDPGINRASTIVGDYTGTDSAYHSFFREKGGTPTSFDAPGATNTLAGGINNGGTISGPYQDSNGYHGYLRAPDGSYTEFDAPGVGGLGTIADKLNNKGWVSGDYTDASNVFHAYLRDPSGNFTEYDAPDAGTGYRQGTGGEGGINRRVTVAAVYIDASNVPHGYMCKKNGSLVEFDPPGSTYTETWDLNDSNLIVGDYIDSGGVYHGYIRTP